MALDINAEVQADFTVDQLLSEDKGIVFTGETSTLSLNVGDTPTTISMQFEGGYATYSNSIGWYQIDENGNPYNLQILNTAPSVWGTSTDSSMDSIINATGEIGFFMLPDSGNNEEFTNIIDTNSYQMEAIETSSGNYEIQITDGTTTISLEALFSNNEFNKEGLDSVISTQNEDGTITIGFEDTSLLSSDMDYDDFVFTLVESHDTTAQELQAWQAARNLIADGKDDSYLNDENLPYAGDDVVRTKEILVGELNYNTFYSQSNANSVIEVTEGLDLWGVKAGAGDDIVYDNNESNRIEGGLGADTLYGNGGDDRIMTAGDERHEVDTDDDFVIGGAGNDEIYLYGGNDTVVLTNDNYGYMDSIDSFTFGKDKLDISQIVTSIEFLGSNKHMASQLVDISNAVSLNWKGPGIEFSQGDDSQIVQFYDGVMNSRLKSVLKNEDSLESLFEDMLNNKTLIINHIDQNPLETYENSVLTIDKSVLLENDSIPFGTDLSIVSVQEALNGTVKLDLDGNIVFTPEEDFFGETSFSYTVVDGDQFQDTAIVTINIVPVKDTISSLIDNDESENSIYENVALGTYTGVTLNAIDGSGDSITYSIPEDIPFTVDSNGRIITSGEIDHEIQNIYNFTAIATSSDGSQSTKEISIKVKNILETLLTHEGGVFDGSSNNGIKIEGSESFNIQGNALSVSATIKPESDNSQWNYIISNGGGYGHDGFQLVQKDNGLRFELNGKAFDVEDVLESGKAQVVTATYDGATVKIFVDAKNVGEFSYRGGVGSYDGVVEIGGNPFRDNYDFNGTISNVKVFDSALSQSEIEALSYVHEGTLTLDDTVLKINTEPTFATLTFEYETAGFRNVVGYFTYDENGDLTNPQIIINDQNLLESGTVVAQLQTNLKYGFFVVADGANRYNDGDEISFDNSGDLPRLLINGSPTYNVWFDNAIYNSDEHDHYKFSVDENGEMTIQLEDLPNNGDADFTDVVLHSDYILNVHRLYNSEGYEFTNAPGTTTINATLDNAPESEMIVTLSNGATITFEAGQTQATSTPFSLINEDGIYEDGSSQIITIVSVSGGEFDVIDSTDTSEVLMDVMPFVIEDAQHDLNVTKEYIIEDQVTTTNLVVTLDVSGSMVKSYYGGVITLEDGSTTTRFDLAKEAIINTINSYNLQGDVNVNLTLFGKSAINLGWTSGDDALEYLENLTMPAEQSSVYSGEDRVAISTGGTDFYDAIQATDDIDFTNYNADKTVGIFISDGEPNNNASLIDNDTDAAIVTWKEFVDENIDELNVIGIGSNISTRYLDIIQVQDGIDAQIVSDETGLNQLLLKTTGDAVSGNIVNSIDFQTGSFDKVISVKLGDILYTSEQSTIETPEGGIFTINFQTGEYSYIALPSNYSSNANEIFTVSVADNTGDIVDVKINVNVDLKIIDAPDAPDAPVITNITDTLDDDISTVNISGSASANSSIELFNGDSSIGTTIADENGNWEIKDLDFTDGYHNITAYATKDSLQSKVSDVSIVSINNNIDVNNISTNYIVSDEDDTFTVDFLNSQEVIEFGEGNDTLVIKISEESLSELNNSDLTYNDIFDAQAEQNDFVDLENLENIVIVSSDETNEEIQTKVDSTKQYSISEGSINNIDIGISQSAQELIDNAKQTVDTNSI